MEGHKSGRLTVTSFNCRRLKYKDGRNNQTLPFWNCLCTCGKTAVVEEDKLKRVKTLSCGCLKDERRELANTTHGKHKSNTYKSWDTMLQRCTNPKNTNYNYYGGRGITVCQRWVDSFENFLEDMGERPKGFSLDRINGNSSYSKENCKWSDKLDQTVNKGIPKNNKSGIKGVCWSKRDNKWLVQFKYGDFKFRELYEDFELARKTRIMLEEMHYCDIRKNLLAAGRV